MFIHHSNVIQNIKQMSKISFLFLMYKFKLPYNVITMTTITKKLQHMVKIKLNKRIII